MKYQYFIEVPVVFNDLFAGREVSSYPSGFDDGITPYVIEESEDPHLALDASRAAARILQEAFAKHGLKIMHTYTLGGIAVLDKWVEDASGNKVGRSGWLDAVAIKRKEDGGNLKVVGFLPLKIDKYVSDDVMSVEMAVNFAKPYIVDEASTRYTFCYHDGKKSAFQSLSNPNFAGLTSYALSDSEAHAESGAGGAGVTVSGSAPLLDGAGVTVSGSAPLLGGADVTVSGSAPLLDCADVAVSGSSIFYDDGFLGD